MADSNPLTGYTDTRVYSLSTQSPNVALGNGTAKSIVKFNLPGVVQNTDDVQSMSIRLRNVSIPNVFKNVTDGILNYSYVWHITSPPSSGTYNGTLTIATGTYDIFSLMDALNAAVAAQPIMPDGVVLQTLITFLFNYYTNRVEIVAENLAGYSGSLTIAFSSFVSQLGFTRAVQIIAGSPSIATYGAQLAGVSRILIQCPDLPTNNWSTELGTNMFAVVQITGNYLDTIHYSFETLNGFPIAPSTIIENLTFILTDQNGDLLDFDNYDWSIIFEIVIIRQKSPEFEDLNQSLKRLIDQNMKDDGTSEEKQKGMTAEELRIFAETQTTESLKQLQDTIKQLEEEKAKSKNV